MNQTRLADALAAALLLSACGRTIPLSYQVKDTASCTARVTDGRLKQGGMDIKMDYPTTFIGTPEFIPFEIVPTAAEVVRSEVCGSALRDRDLSIEIGKLACDAKLGFTQAVARIEMQLLVRQAGGPFTPVLLTHREVIDQDVAPKTICDRAMTSIVANLAGEAAVATPQK